MRRKQDSVKISGDLEGIPLSRGSNQVLLEKVLKARFSAEFGREPLPLRIVAIQLSLNPTHILRNLR